MQLRARGGDGRFVTDRKQLVRIICSRGKIVGFPRAWAALYRRFEYEYGIDLPGEAMSRGVGPLDVAQQMGHMSSLLLLATR
jgi:hypothetical protein